MLHFDHYVNKNTNASGTKKALMHGLFAFFHIAPLFLRIQTHDDVIKWKHFPRNWPFVRGIHRSPHKGQWRGALMFSLICVWINGWVNNREAGDLRRYRGHYDVTVKIFLVSVSSSHKGPVGWRCCTPGHGLNRQWNCQWFETLWPWCEITVIPTVNLAPAYILILTNFIILYSLPW